MLLGRSAEQRVAAIRANMAAGSRGHYFRSQNRDPLATPKYQPYSPGIMSGTAGGGLYGSLWRTQQMMRQYSFNHPVAYANTYSPVANLLNRPPQIDPQQALEEYRKAQQEAKNYDYGSLMTLQVGSQLRRFLQDGWAYLRDKRYPRAISAFDTAHEIDPIAPSARFGQVIATVAAEQYRRAMTRLAMLLLYETRRSPEIPSMFEYNANLQNNFGSVDDLRECMLSLRTFSQLNPQNPHVQALYVYVLWYSRFQDAMKEAESIALSIARQHPDSPWASFFPMIQRAVAVLREAQRVADEAANAKAGSPPAVPAPPDGATSNLTGPTVPPPPPEALPPERRPTGPADSTLPPPQGPGG